LLDIFQLCKALTIIALCLLIFRK